MPSDQHVRVWSTLPSKLGLFSLVAYLGTCIFFYWTSAMTTSSFETVEFKPGLYFDVWWPNRDRVNLPTCIFYHGGGLMKESAQRNQITTTYQWMIERSLNASVAIISADYSLMPGKSALDMVKDVQDLLQFLQEDKRFDTSRYVIAASSAGNYPAMLAALRDPKPKALACFWPMSVFLTDDWWFRRHNPLPLWLKDAPKDSAFARYLMNGNLLDDLIAEPSLGSRLREYSGNDRASLIPPDKRYLFPETLISSSFPPTAIAHGSSDTIVPYSQGVWLFDSLKAHGVETRMWTSTGGDHGLLGDVDGAEAAQLKRNQTLDFALKHLL